MTPRVYQAHAKHLNVRDMETCLLKEANELAGGSQLEIASSHPTQSVHFPIDSFRLPCNSFTRESKTINVYFFNVRENNLKKVDTP